MSRFHGSRWPIRSGSEVGGVKDSGFGHEGPRYAGREMMEEPLVTIFVLSVTSAWQRRAHGAGGTNPAVRA
jgi:hypothetical protein